MVIKLLIKKIVKWYDTMLKKGPFLIKNFRCFQLAHRFDRKFQTKYYTKTVSCRTVILNIVSAFRKICSLRPEYYEKREKRVQTDELVENI